jgi:hypothetical protein
MADALADAPAHASSHESANALANSTSHEFAYVDTYECSNVEITCHAPHFADAGSYARSNKFPNNVDNDRDDDDNNVDNHDYNVNDVNNKVDDLDNNDLDVGSHWCTDALRSYAYTNHHLCTNFCRQSGQHRHCRQRRWKWRWCSHSNHHCGGGSAALHRVDSCRRSLASQSRCRQARVGRSWGHHLLD